MGCLRESCLWCTMRAIIIFQERTKSIQPPVAIQQNLRKSPLRLMYFCTDIQTTKVIMNSTAISKHFNLHYCNATGKLTFLATVAYGSNPCWKFVESQTSIFSKANFRAPYFTAINSNAIDTVLPTGTPTPAKTR